MKRGIGLCKPHAVIMVAMRWAFKIAYLGEKFHGYQRQPSLRTVEGSILEALESGGAIINPQESGFQSASRTDRGVHALGNVVAFETSLHPRQVIASTNSRLEDVWFYAHATVDPDFNPRHAVERWYRYYMPGRLSLERLNELCAIFVGDHDFRSFAKHREEGRCSLKSVECTRQGEHIALDVRGDRFLWSMVRRIARALELASEGSLAADDLRRGLEGDAVPLEPAPPEFLCLMDVSYDIDFEYFTARRLGEEIVALGDVRRVTGDLMAHLQTLLTGCF